jgi:uncharacterized membrane protein YgcG
MRKICLSDVEDSNRLILDIAIRRAVLFSLTGLLITFLFTSNLSYVTPYAIAQETYPDSIFASTNQAQLHELVLKATQENGLTSTVAGFKVDLTNVVSAPANSELAIFTTDSALSINEAKVKTTTDAFIDLVKQSQNSFSLTGLPAGVYTLDVITQKGNARAAYEGILVLGQEPTNIQTRTIIEQQIVRENNDDDDGNNGNASDGNCDHRSYPNVCIRPYPPDLDCPEIQYTDFKVLPPDPHDFDREGNGIGCESGTVSVGNIGQDGNETLLPRDPCLDNPTLPECPDPCIENPDAEGCPKPLPPIDPCEEDPSLPGCQEDTGDGSDSEDEGDGGSSDNESEDENDEGTDGGDEGGGDEGGGDEGGGGGDEEAGADEE